MSLSKIRREAILERDDHVSQMRHYSESEGWHKSLRTAHLQVHHILPRRIGGLDVPENLITLARVEHIGESEYGFIINPLLAFVVHPDNTEALLAYRRGDKDAYKKMFAKRDELVAQGIPYWNTEHDAEMFETAFERTLAAALLGWTFPSNK